LLCREYRVTEVGAVSEATVRIAPLPLMDSQQLRLKRMYPSATFRATTSTVVLPIPRTGTGIGAPRVRDLELVRVVAGLLLALDGRPPTDVDITNLTGGATMSARAKSR
jgi:transcription-repair coupling factor (superfamily II helicase)